MTQWPVGFPLYINSYFPRAVLLADIGLPSHKVNQSGLEEIPHLSFQLAALMKTSLDINPSHLLKREWHQPRVHTERFLHACKCQTQNSPTPLWYLLKVFLLLFSTVTSPFSPRQASKIWEAMVSLIFQQNWIFYKGKLGGIHPLCKLHLGCLPRQFILRVWKQ